MLMPPASTTPRRDTSRRRRNSFPAILPCPWHISAQGSWPQTIRLRRVRPAARFPHGQNNNTQARRRRNVMSTDEREDNTIYKVVVNHEEQYSIWPADRENALGWSDAGKTGTKQECLAYIEEVWTDMRPLSLRKKMEESAGK